MDEVDRGVLDRLQTGFPICERPYASAAAELGLSEADLLARLRRLREEGVITRFGPLYNVERMGGEFVLCALRVPAERFEAVAECVNAFPEVAHNYERDHEFNMWFVIAAESRARAESVARRIERTTGLPVYRCPKLAEYHVGLYLKSS
jgi:DNA-binding Lrp family transcriptional regulator